MENKMTLKSNWYQNYIYQTAAVLPHIYSDGNINQIEQDASWKENMLHILMAIAILGFDATAISHIVQKNKVNKALVENAMRDQELIAQLKEIIANKENDPIARSIYEDAKEDAMEVKNDMQASQTKQISDKMPSKIVVDDNLINAIKAVEGSGSGDVSHAGASGTMQIMKPTWEEVNKEYFNGKYPYEQYRFNDEINMLIGKTYVQKLANMIEAHEEKWQQNQSDPYMLLLAAYNWGYGNVRKTGFDINVIKERVPSVYDYALRGRNMMGWFTSQAPSRLHPSA